jgi:hypothetical protein
MRVTPSSGTLRLLLFSLSLLLVTAPLLQAQTGSSGSIIGVVTDEGGRPLVGLEVVVEHTGIGTRLRTVTDQAGRFRVVNLPAGGPYALTVRGLGIRETRRTGLRLQAGEALRLDITATPDAVTIEGVEVRGQPVDQIINPSRTGSATLLDQVTIAATPTVSRNIMELTALSPLVRRSTGFSIAGQNERYNVLRLDGASIQDVFGLSPHGVAGGQGSAKPVPLAALSQYQILVSPFEVRHSGFTGGLLNAVTRSGTNAWEGSAFYYRRDHNLVGDFIYDQERVRPTVFERELMGGSLGGPLVRDRLHLFVAWEQENRLNPSRGFAFGEGDARAVGIAPDSMARFISILENQYGIEAGDPGAMGLENPLGNVFGRLDWQPAAGHRLSLKLNHVTSDEEVSPLRDRRAEYGLSSTAYRYQARSDAATLQWTSQLGAGAANELLLHFQQSSERNDPFSDAPFIEVDLWSSFGGIQTFRRLQAGATPGVHASRLEQNVMQVANQVTFGAGGHEMAFGLSFDRFSVRHLNLPSSRGVYRFGSLFDLENNDPSFYQMQVTTPYLLANPERMILVQVGTYFQDEWSPARGLRVQAGIRADLPMLHTTPEENPRVRRAFGYGTSDAATVFPMISPRIGANWQSEGRLRTQMRAGAGIFSGRPPLAWLAQAYSYDGHQLGWRICPTQETAPRLDIEAELPRICAGSQVERPIRQAVMIDPNFRFPQDFRTALGVDQELPLAFIGSLELVFTHALYQVHLMDLNFGERVEEPRHPTSFPAFLGPRVHFGIPTGEGFTPNRRDAGFQQALLLTNRSRNQAFTISTELQRPVGRALTLRGAYSYTRSFDTQSLVSADLAESYGATAVWRDPNDPNLRPSHYDQPHKVVLSAVGRRRQLGGETQFSIAYSAESGTPYSYVYFNDVNGDGYPGPGHALGGRNDLFNIPERVTQIPASVPHLVLLAQLIEEEPCLRDWKGGIAPRNSCRAPVSHMLDLRGGHTLNLPRGVRAEVTADLMNALNLLNSDWGHVYRAPPTVPVLAHEGRGDGMRGGASGTDPLVPLFYVGPTRLNAAGVIEAAPGYSAIFPESQWQAQLGVRVFF